MKFNLERSPANIINRYDPGCAEIHPNQPEISQETGEPLAKKITQSFILTATQLIEDWDVDAQLLTIQALQPVLDLEPDVLLVGTGPKAIFPSHDVIQFCYQAGVGIEIMNSAAACRTYNVLASELRNVAVAITVV